MTTAAPTYKSTFLKTLHERGFIHQGTNLEGLDQLLSEGKPVTCYIGFDATADSLHVGSLVQIMLLRHFQKSGHRPIVLMGGATTKIGDPTGKDEARKFLSEEDIANNISGIQKIFAHYVTFGNSPTDALMLNNNDWLGQLNYIDFLRDVGKHFTINRMLTFDSVKLRLEREQPMSFLEFNYMILQAYDFMHLSQKYGCMLQMGGADQWGNIVSGIDLSRRLLKDEVFGVTSPLITTSSGGKMGKTAQGAIWLNAEKCSVYDFWQFWRNTEDADVGRFLRLFTELPLSEIEKLEKLEGSEINQAKIILANEATSLCHGKEAALQAHKTATETFSNHMTSEGLPHIDLEKSKIENGIALVDLLIQAQLASSKGEARRLIEGGGARLNDQAISDRDYHVSLNDFSGQENLKLSSGKKKHVIVKMS